MQKTKNRKWISIICSFVFLAGCSGLDIKKSEHEGPRGSNPEVSVLTGKAGGFKLLDSTGGEKNTDVTMPVNALLWRAALDTASVVPIDNVDTFSGSIVTEWYQESAASDQRLKLAFFVMGLELRSDTIKVRAYVQKRHDNNWIDSGQDEKLARQLEDLVLARARELRSKMLAESVK
jgi:hypothetical protein